MGGHPLCCHQSRWSRYSGGLWSNFVNLESWNIQNHQALCQCKGSTCTSPTTTTTTTTTTTIPTTTTTAHSCGEGWSSTETLGCIIALPDPAASLQVKMMLMIMMIKTILMIQGECWWVEHHQDSFPQLDSNVDIWRMPGMLAPPSMDIWSKPKIRKSRTSLRQWLR